MKFNLQNHVVELLSSVGTRRVGFTRFNVAFCLAWLRANVVNRPVNWGHAWTLCKSFRNPESSKCEWVDESSMLILDIREFVADGQHRAIGYVLAYGRAEDIHTLRDILGLPALKGPPEVPVSGWALCPPGTDEPNLYLVLQTGAREIVGDKCDTDQRKRTGADQLARHTESANLLAEFDMSPQEMQGALMLIYKRSLPPGSVAQKKGDKYGSIRRGGNVHPDRFPLMLEAIESRGNLLSRAMGVLYEGPVMQAVESVNLSLRAKNDKHTDKWLHELVAFSPAQLLAGVVLALQGGVKVGTIQAALVSWVDAATKGKCESLACVYQWAMASKQGPKSFHPSERFCLLTRYIQADEPNPTIGKGAYKSPEYAVKVLRERLGITDDISAEQVTANRLPGWDSGVSVDQIMSKAAKKAAKRRTKKSA